MPDLWFVTAATLIGLVLTSLAIARDVRGTRNVRAYPV